MEQATARLWLEIALSVKNPDSAISKLKELVPVQREWQKPTPQMIHAGRAIRWLRKTGGRLLKDPILKLFFEHAERVQETLPELYKNLVHKSEGMQPVVPRLEITSFGNVEVRHNQRVIELSDWQTREARDLFFFLLQSTALTKEQIALVFWPDISPARLKMRFKINIYRIRKAVGPDAILFEDDRYRFNKSINYSWDREKFDELFESLQQKNAVPGRTRLLEQAVVLIRGTYLANLDAEWAMLEQLKYQELYRYAMLELATIYLKEGKTQECLNTARLVLCSDSLLEAAHRLIIQTYATLHDPAGMTLQYRQYQQTLEEQLGLQPSTEISNLYEQLLDAI